MIVILGISILFVILLLYTTRNIDTFVSDSYLANDRKNSALTADPTCPKGQYSKKTGGPCSGFSSDAYDYNKDAPETALGVNGQRFNVGSYDRDPNKKDEVDYTKTDVLKKPATITYSRWATDPKTNRDINTNSQAPDSQFRGTDDVVEDKDGLPSGRTKKDLYDYKYDTSLRSSRNFRNSGYHDEYDTSKKHEYAKKNRPSVDELIRASDRKYREIPTFKRRGSSEDEYLDNRLSGDKGRKGPYELPYTHDSTRGYSSGATCNNESYDGDEPQEDDCCEGFSSLK